MADELARGLDADAFDVKHVCARVLVGLRKQNPALVFDEASLLTSVRLALPLPPTEERRLEHVCNLLSLVFPLEPMQLTCSALRSTKPAVRGVALEYLDALLPLDIRATLLHQLEAPAAGHPAPAATTERALDELYRSGELSRPDLDSHGTPRVRFAPLPASLEAHSLAGCRRRPNGRPSATEHRQRRDRDHQPAKAKNQPQAGQKKDRNGLDQGGHLGAPGGGEGTQRNRTVELLGTTLPFSKQR